MNYNVTTDTISPYRLWRFASRHGVQNYGSTKYLIRDLVDDSVAEYPSVRRRPERATRPKYD